MDFKEYLKKDLVFFRHFISCITDLNYDQSVIGIIQDITDISNMSYKLQLATIIFNKALEGVVITDPEGTIIDVNPAFTKITGYTKQEAIGKNPRILKSNKHPPEFYKKMWEDLTKKKGGGKVKYGTGGKIKKFILKYYQYMPLKTEMEKLLIMYLYFTI